MITRASPTEGGKEEEEEVEPEGPCDNVTQINKEQAAAGVNQGLELIQR